LELSPIGRVINWQGDYQQAITYYQESIALNEKVGISPSTWPRVHTAYAFLRQDEIAQSKGMFRLGIQQFQKANNIIGLVYTIEGLASLLVEQDQSEHAERLFAWADAMREKFNDFRPPVEQASVERDLAVIHSILNNVEFASLSAEGRAMTEEQATAYALELSVGS
jgi:tetratricopeptide (TPR) repeat protein